ncbi:MAG: autotransporter assembly complex family protein [Casimicrobiaceae bacterium]
MSRRTASPSVGLCMHAFARLRAGLSVALYTALCAALALASLVVCGVARAEEAPDAAAGALRYRVEIEAPKALVKTLRDSLDIVRWQDYEATTAIVLQQLMKEAKQQAAEAAATEGYFNAAVDVSIDAAPAEDGRRVVKVNVVPGEPAHIDGVDINVTGPATDDRGRGEQAIATIRRDWTLKKGARFRQEAWDSAKDRAVTTLAASPYAAARMTDSEARVFPEQLRADLSVKIESGPLFRFGPVVVEGLDKYDPAVVKNFSTFEPAEPYSTERLDQYVRRLQGSGYFASVQARIEPDPDQAEAAPVRVSVIEAPRHRIEGGLIYSTDNRFGANGRYTDVNFNERARKLEVTGRIDFTIQELGVTLARPPSSGGYIDSARAKVQRTDISGLQTRTGLVGVQRQTLEERDQTTYSLTYYEDEQRPQGFPAERARALYAAYGRTWRNVDALLSPTRGYALETEVGVAPVATRIFGRVIGRTAWWIPFGTSNELQLRLEGGAVLGTDRTGVPSALLFRTGGDTTVRGYAFESLGVNRGEAVLGGRYYAVGSVEATHYFNERLGAAVFVDGGNAADTAADLRPVFGYGVGARVRTPVGPFRVDIAYGQESSSIRLHMSLGVRF